METRYGEIDITRGDVRTRECWSLDMRQSTAQGPWTEPDRSELCSAGTFTLSVCAFSDGEIPIGEIRILWRNIEVSVVGHPTGREDVIEVTPEHLQAAMGNAEYRQTLISWMEAAA